MGGALLDLGTLGGRDSEALDLNDSGFAVGNSDLPRNLGVHAFVYSPIFGMQDLNELIDPDLGLELFSANDINDRGQILATAVIDGEGHAVLLTPIAGVPDGGSTAMLFVCALASLMVLRQFVASNTATTFDVF